MRMFVAALPPQDVLAHLDDFLDVRREAGAFRWTLADQVHLTLAFLAEVPDRCLDPLVECLAAAASRRSAIPVALAGGGAFPDVVRGRVLYAGLAVSPDGASELDRLAAGVRTAASTSGATVSGERFRPHLTVARCGRPTELTRWVRLLDAYRGRDWTLDTISLVASHLREGPRRRPRHEVVAEFALAGGG